MFFAKPGEYEAAGLYSLEHLILLILTIVAIIVAVKFTKNKNKEQVRKIIQIVTVFIWILEIIKITFNLIIGNANKPNTYIPLYFCSIILYAGILSGFCRGKLKRTGDIFLATGSLVAGIIFLICPNTSLSTYPIWHYISIQSFILHGSMIYLGILVNITGYVEVKSKDIIYYSSLMLFVSLIALVYNNIYDSNLMFISKDFPGTPIHIFYNITGNMFTFFMIIIQATLPFYIVFLALEVLQIIKEKIKLLYIQDVPHLNE